MINIDKEMNAYTSTKKYNTLSVNGADRIKCHQNWEEILICFNIAIKESEESAKFQGINNFFYI